MDGGGGSFLSRVTESVSKLDAFPKFAKYAKEQTNSGAIVSLSAIVLMIILAISEFKHYSTLERVETMEVDRGRGEQLRINFDITFTRVPCSMISMDAQDVSGMTLTDIMHNVFKRRLDSDGRPLGRVERNLLGNAITKEEDLLKEKQRAMTEGRPTVTAANAAMLGQKCGSCYGAGEGNECCQTCDEVRDAYRKKGWSFDPSTAEQCSQEGLISDVQVPPDKLEGCNLYGFVKVPRGSGNIHFAPGRAFQAAHAHVDDLLTFTADKFNISHRVNNFSFGDYYQDRVNPLDGVEHSLASGSGIQQYYLKVVPTEFEYVNGRRVISNQFSATSHLREIDVTNPRNVPGVFFSFDLSPIRVHIIERRRSFGHFLTNLCAIIGGVFTVMGLVDSTLHGILNRSAGRGRPGGILERD